MDSTSSVTHIGLCAGYGGIELGLQRAIPNLRSIALCEIEAFAIANLVAKMEAGLMDPAPIWPDLKTFPWEAFRDRVDILTGGYPCQPFSAAGKRAGKDDPRHLWPWIADGIRLLRPRLCFFENVEGHISLGLSDVIENLAGMGYRTTWGIFSASEVGAPHQRKRVFILAYRDSERGQLSHWRRLAAESLPISNGQARGDVWPSRPGEQQYGWEPPRVVGSRHLENPVGNGSGSQSGNPLHQGWSTGKTGGESLSAATGRSACASIADDQSAGGDGKPPRVVSGRTAMDDSKERNLRSDSQDQWEADGESHAPDKSGDSGGKGELADSHRLDRSAQAEGREHDQQVGPAGEEMGNAESGKDNGREPGDMEAPTGKGGCCDDAADGAGEELGDTEGRDGLGSASREAGHAAQSDEGDDDGQAEPTVGLHTDERSSVLGETLTFNPNGDNVAWYEKPTEKTRAREVLFEVWIVASTEGIQWETGRLQYLLAEKILQSGVQLDGFTQRICFFVWCLQTGHQTQGWGLHGMQVYESSRGSSQGQKPIEQLKRELGYAMCQLSYEIALERGQDPVETTGIMQGVRKSSERAWSLSKALPEMEEVWRSTLDQTVWENGCFIEAASKGNRTDELRLLGNGVVPATAERAFRVLIQELL